MGDYLGFSVSVGTCFMTKFVVNSGEYSMRYLEEGILFCVCVKYSVDIC